jgi:hypothetical protein
MSSGIAYCGTLPHVGAIDIDTPKFGFQAVTVSSNKCMQGGPGPRGTTVQNTVLESPIGDTRLGRIETAA